MIATNATPADAAHQILRHLEREGFIGARR
jgi:hypothetical protein